MKITDTVHLLKIDFEIAISPSKKIPRFVNVIIVFGDKITLIDSGVKGSENKIFDYISKQGREITDVERIILSHSHPDHIGSAAKIKEKTNCKILAHCQEQEWIEDIKQQNKERPVPGFFELVDTSVKVDKIISDDIFEINLKSNLTIRLIKSPGHSKGMLNVLFIEDRILFTADSIPLKNDIPNYDNFKELKESLAKIKNSNEYQVLLSSWAPPLLNKVEIENLIADGEEYLQEIDSAVKKFYHQKNSTILEDCKQVLEKLGLPLFLSNPLIERAFRSHF